METLDPVCLKAAAADVIGGPLSLRAKLLRKLIVPAVTAFIACKRMAYRLKRPWGGKLGHLDHLTILVATRRSPRSSTRACSVRRS
jgi:hypothetical protein